MKTIVYLLLYLAILFFGAVAHERDLARNFNKTGDAKAWFCEIKIK